VTQRVPMCRGKATGTTTGRGKRGKDRVATTGRGRRGKDRVATATAQWASLTTTGWWTANRGWAG
jgi:hypothetical protein